MVLTDCCLSAGVPVYLFSETVDNEASVLAKGVQLLQGGRVSGLAIVKDIAGANRGYPGAESWHDQLITRGVPSEKISFIRCENLLHTYVEAQALVMHAQRYHWRKVVIVAPPFHQLRAFMAVVSAMKLLRFDDLRVYNQVGSKLSWDEDVFHSQGKLQATRRELVVTELRRIYLYHEKGDLVSIDEALEYLAWRDKP